MTTYRFPEILGGGEHEAAPEDDPTYPRVGFDLPGIEDRLWLERACLTEVKPALPEEPPVGAYRIGGVLCMRVTSKPNKYWVYQTADELFDEKTFEAICSDHGRDIVRLVPESVAEPVTLPWAGVSLYGSPLAVHLGQHDPINVYVGREGASVGSETAREMARALNAVADAAERAS